jgi:magnesium transporter
MTETEIHEPWKELQRLADEGQPEKLEVFLDQLQPSDIALAISRLSEDDQTHVLSSIEPEEAADLVEQLPEAQAVSLLEHLEPRSAAAILDGLPSDDQADLINKLDKPDADAILEEMDPAAAADLRVLAAYASDTAGGIMVTEFLKYPEDATVDEVVRDLREHADEYGDYDVQYTYICDKQERLIGVLRMRDLLLSAPRSTVADLMIAAPLSVRDSASLDELVEFFGRHHFLGVPVVDDAQRLLGVVHKTAVDEAQSDRSLSDFFKTQGIVSGEEIRTMPVILRARRRLGWLSVNILLNVIAASVIAAYQETLSAVIALAVFLPIISDMSGCSGNQAVAVSLRELALGLARAEDVWRVWLKEIAVGVLNGVVLGVLIGVVAWLWKGNAFLGIVVGSALCLNTMVAVSIGGVVPLIAKRLRIDPAIASGPILTTVTDMCGFFLVLGTATLLLSQLAGL